MYEILASIQSAIPQIQNAAGQWLGTIVLFVPLVRFVQLQHAEPGRSDASAVPTQS